MARIAFVTLLLIGSLVAASPPPADWQVVEQVLSRKGTGEKDMLKVTFPRSDLSVRVGDVSVEPGLALTSWLGFKGMGEQAMMMGDLVLLEKEVAPVMTRLVAQGIEITALHNHLLNTSPVVMYLHFSGTGDSKRLAEAMRSALALTGTPLDTPKPATPLATAIDWRAVETVLGRTGQKKGNLFQVSFPRKEMIEEHGMVVPPFLGMATGINLQMVGRKAATTGDFVLTGSEVNPVIKALVDNGIAVTAVHSHMLFESPRLFFLHFWGYDEPERLARGLKAALDKTNTVK
ncbi:MAG TPA: DUF1259 domain-containing protein [Geobacteraceae bacterium]